MQCAKIESGSNFREIEVINKLKEQNLKIRTTHNYIHASLVLLNFNAILFYSGL